MTTITAGETRSRIGVRPGGWALVVAGLTGAASGVFLAFAPPAVGSDRFSYPLSAAGFTAIQTFFFVHHLAVAFGLFVVWRSGRAGRGRLAAVGGVLATGSMGLLAVQELVAITAAGSLRPSALTDLIESVYGVLSLLNGVALIIFGIAAVMARGWHGWRRVILLVLGVYVIIPLTPAIFGPFVVARLTIAGWMLLFAALGWALLRAEPRRRA